VKRKQKAKARSAQPYKLFGLSDQPRGDAVHLQNAKKFLAPFSQTSLSGPDYKLSEQFAEFQIKEIAALYNSHSIQAATSPRSNAPRERFAALARKATELHRLIATMGDIERAFYEGADEDRELYEQAKVDWLPRSSVTPRPDSDSKWLTQLAAFSKLSTKVLGIYNQKVGPDVGGRTSVHTEMHNSPEYVLINYGWELFEKHRPGEATTSETGDFHMFLQQIYEYATARGANEVGAPALIPKIKQMLKPLRDYQNYIQNSRLADKLDAKLLKGLMKGTPIEKLRPIANELKATLAKMDSNAVAALNKATTRRRARS